jgi:hypothetical protein
MEVNIYDFSRYLENLSHSRRETLNFPTNLVEKGVRFRETFSHYVKSQVNIPANLPALFSFLKDVNAYFQNFLFAQLIFESRHSIFTILNLKYNRLDRVAIIIFQVF